MRAVIVYESMFGNTHLIADAIAEGLAPGNEVTVVPVAQAGRELLDGADLVVAGGPTHIHGMSGARSREGAVEMAHKDGSQLTLDPSAEGPGLRDWLAGLGQIHTRGAAFDTRLPARRCSPGARQRRSPNCWSGAGSPSSAPLRASWSPRTTSCGRASGTGPGDGAGNWRPCCPPPGRPGEAWWSPTSGSPPQGILRGSSPDWSSSQAPS